MAAVIVLLMMILSGGNRWYPPTAALQVGPLHWGEPFAQVIHDLGPAPVVKDCPQAWTCHSTLTYAKGSTSVVLDNGGNDGTIDIIRVCAHEAKLGARTMKTNVQATEKWTWNSRPILGAPSKTVPGWSVDVNSQVPTDMIFTYKSKDGGFFVVEEFSNSRGHRCFSLGAD
jgi:hypothetical protein